MSIISECLRQILSARYGRDVRQAIHDGIQQCYYDGKAGSIDLEARQEIEALKDAKDTTATTSPTMPNSYDGRLKIDEIGGGESKQDSTSGKNLLDCSGLTETTSNGVTFTPVYENGMLQYINVNGTATALVNYTVATTTYIANQEYVLSGCPSGGGGSTYKIKATNDSKYADYGNGVTFSYTEDTSSSVIIVVYSGTTISNIKFYPMLRDSSIGDAIYEPYTNGASPNPSYPQEIKKTVVSEIRTHGKNLLKNNATSQTINGVTFTINSDGTVTANGTATANAQFTIFKTIPLISGRRFNVIQLGGTYTGDMYHVAFDANWAGGKDSKLNQSSEMNDTINYSRFRLTVKSGAVCNNLRVGFMVATEGYDTYEPYTESAITLSQPIELYGMGDVQDIITPKQIKRKYVSVDFDGSADEDLRQDSTYMFRIPLKQRGVAYGKNQLCTRLIRGASYSAIQKAENSFGVSGVALILHIEGVTSIDELRAWLVEHPITVVYETEAEVVGDLPIADQIALNSLATYDGITYLEFDSEIEPTFKGEYGTSKVGGCTLEGAMKANANALMLNGDSFEFAEHGLTFKGLKVGKMVTVQVSGALDYGITDENKVKTFASVIPEGFRPIATTHIGCFSVSSKDGNGNRLTNMFDLAVGGSGAIQFQVELKNSEGQSITTSSTGMPLNMAISYISE